MNPERILGRDPAPGSLATVDDGAAVLRESVLVLAEGRGRLDATVVDSPWRGAHAAPVVDAVGDLRERLDVLETAVVDFSAAWQEWRHGLARRRDLTAELVEVVSQLDGDDARRGRVLEQADALAEEHRAAAGVLAAAADELAQAATVTDERDVARGLRRAFDGLDEAVRDWVDAHGEQTARAGAAVTAVSGLTAVVPHLLGVADDTADDTADDADVRELASAAPGSHRLLDALDEPPSTVDESALAAASFAPAAAPSIGDRLRGGPRQTDSGGDDGADAGTAQPDAADDWGDGW